MSQENYVQVWDYSYDGTATVLLFYQYFLYRLGENIQLYSSMGLLLRWTDATVKRN